MGNTTFYTTESDGVHFCEFDGNFAQVLVDGALCHVKRDCRNMYVCVGMRPNTPPGYECPQPYFVQEACLDEFGRLFCIMFNMSFDMLKPNIVVAFGTPFSEQQKFDNKKTNFA